MNKLIFRIEEPSEIARWKNFAKQVCDEKWALSLEFIKSRGFLCVPKEKGRHFEDFEAERFSSALLHSFGNIECISVDTEGMSFDDCFRIIGTKKGLIEFSQVNAGLNVLLTNANVDFVLLLTSESYDLYCGNKEFLEYALGNNLEVLLRNFKEYAMDECWRGTMMQVYDKYVTKLQ